jgi:hypothetical protein
VEPLISTTRSKLTCAHVPKKGQKVLIANKLTHHSLLQIINIPIIMKRTHLCFDSPICLFFCSTVFGLYFGGVFDAMKRCMVYVWETSRRNECFILVFAWGTKRILEESKQRERPKGPFCNCDKVEEKK